MEIDHDRSASTSEHFQANSETILGFKSMVKNDNSEKNMNIIICLQLVGCDSASDILFDINIAEIL